MQQAGAAEIPYCGPNDAVVRTVSRDNRNWPTSALRVGRIFVRSQCHLLQRSAGDAVLPQWSECGAEIHVAVPVGRRAIHAHWAVGVEARFTAARRIDED